VGVEKHNRKGRKICCLKKKGRAAIVRDYLSSVKKNKVIQSWKRQLMNERFRRKSFGGVVGLLPP